MGQAELDDVVYPYRRRNRSGEAGRIPSPDRMASQLKIGGYEFCPAVRGNAAVLTKTLCL